jgi:hypothetical protein
MDYKSFNRAWLELCIGNCRPQISTHPDTFGAEWKKFCNYLDLGIERRDAGDEGRDLPVELPDNPPYITFKGATIQLSMDLPRGIVRLDNVGYSGTEVLNRAGDGKGSFVMEAFRIERVTVDMPILPIGVPSFAGVWCRKAGCGQQRATVVGGAARDGERLYPARQATWKVRDGKIPITATGSIKTTHTNRGPAFEIGPVEFQRNAEFLCESCFTGNYEAYERINPDIAKFFTNYPKLGGPLDLELWEDIRLECKPAATVLDNGGWAAKDVGWTHYIHLELVGGHTAPELLTPRSAKLEVFLINPRQEDGSYGATYWTWDKVLVGALDGPVMKTESGWLEDTYTDPIREALRE